MKNLIRRLVNSLVKSFAAMLGRVSRPFAMIGRLSMDRARLIMAQPSFYARMKSSLTIPEPFYGGTQGGFVRMVNLLIGGVVAIVGLIIVFAYLIPQVYISSGNMTTDLQAAGASSQSIQWWKWLMWGGIVLVVIIILVRITSGKKSY